MVVSPLTSALYLESSSAEREVTHVHLVSSFSDFFVQHKIRFSCEIKEPITGRVNRVQIASDQLNWCCCSMLNVVRRTEEQFSSKVFHFGTKALLHVPAANENVSVSHLHWVLCCTYLQLWPQLQFSHTAKSLSKTF